MLTLSFINASFPILQCPVVTLNLQKFTSHIINDYSTLYYGMYISRGSVTLIDKVGCWVFLF